MRRLRRHLVVQLARFVVAHLAELVAETTTDVRDSPVRKIIWTMSVSVDGYMEGPNREIDWHMVDDELQGRMTPARFDAWLDAETLRPVNLEATHWRYRPLPLLPVSCC